MSSPRYWERWAGLLGALDPEAVPSLSPAGPAHGGAAGGAHVGQDDPGLRAVSVTGVSPGVPGCPQTVPCCPWWSPLYVPELSPGALVVSPGLFLGCPVDVLMLSPRCAQVVPWCPRGIPWAVPELSPGVLVVFPECPPVSSWCPLSCPLGVLGCLCGVSKVVPVVFPVVPGCPCGVPWVSL